MTNQPPHRSPVIRQPSWAWALGAVAFLCFTLGTAIYEFKIFPFAFMNEGYAAARAYYDKHLMSQENFPEMLWQEVRYSGSGVTQHKPDKAYAGYTVFSSAHSQTAFVMTMDGDVVHEWSLPFHEVWKSPDHIDFPLESHQIHYRRVHAFRNGDLLAVYVGAGDTPWGYGLVKMDKDSKLIWRYSERVHHDLDIAADGKIYTLIHRINKAPVPSVHEITSPYLDDSVVILSPDGKEIQRINILQAFVNSDFHWAKTFIAHANDPLHTNTVKVISEDIANTFSFLHAGHIVVSLRNMDTVAVIDPDLKKVVWAMRGPWHFQHDPDFLNNGNLLIFDNLGYEGPGAKSRVLEIDPLTERVVWSYDGDKIGLYSFWRACQQRLPNGNTLITESGSGRLVEVTKEREVVWEYVNPQRGGENQELVPILTGAIRFSNDYFTFINSSGTMKSEG